MNSKVLIIYTGGTIGMIPSEKGFIPDPDFPKKIIKDLGQIKDEQIPPFDIISMSPLLDSSNMTPADWNKIAKVIDKNKNNYQGMIVLHGTDTMAYTASVLGFMLQGLNNSIILTGSQIPYSQVRNDARDNLLTSLIICGNYDIPEVSVYFNNKLFRGCRSTKIDATRFGAFDSPNYPVLAEVGVNIGLRKKRSFNIDLREDLINDKLKKQAPVYYFEQDEDERDYEVGVLRLFPGISADFVYHILQPKLKGLVIEAYGVGNGPTKEKNPEFFKVLSEATKNDDTVIVAVTQCLRGEVILDEYATSLKSAGVISGHDMTVEAALAKLYYLISKEKLNMKEVKKLMQKNCIGELTDDE